jgi:hypothetical protein
MSADDRAAFEATAGDRLAELGYPVETRGRDRFGLVTYRGKTAAWRAVGAVVQRSPVWRRLHPVLERQLSD